MDKYEFRRFIAGCCLWGIFFGAVLGLLNVPLLISILLLGVSGGFLGDNWHYIDKRLTAFVRRFRRD